MKDEPREVAGLVFTPHREVDKGPIVNWIADRTLSFAHFITKLAIPYAIMYSANIDLDEDYEDEEEKVESTPEDDYYEGIVAF